jgi:CRISPR-associated protein Cas5a/b/c
VPLAFLHARLKLHWGFIARQLGASAAQLAYVLPPPPTVVGAFMNPLARILGLGEEVNPRLGPAGSRAMSCALKATLAASAALEGPTGVAVHAEPSRITASLYKTGGDYSRAIREPPYLAVDRLMPVQAAGAASAPGAYMRVAWLLDTEILGDCLGVEVDPKALGAAAWSVYRIGSREGIASPVEASSYTGGELEVLAEGSRFESILYQPADCVEPGGQVVRVILYGPAYREEAYYVPTPIGGPSALTPARPTAFTIQSGCRAARPRGEPLLALAYYSGV